MKALAESVDHFEKQRPFHGAPRRGFLIVHVLKFSRGVVMYLPAGPSGHIISSNYDLCSIITWIGYSTISYISLLGC